MTGQDKEELITEIVKHEWDQFQLVNNEGGRASCQDEPETFRIMRSSQFGTWSEEICRSYLRDLIAAEMQERNLIMEKYARMMASTAPERYRQIEPYLPEVTEEKRQLAESIVSLHLVWMKAHAELYPNLTGRGRYLYTSEDSEWDTSSETYLRGELLTYSVRTLRLLLEFDRQSSEQGMNLVTEQDRLMVLQYGYRDLEAAEKACRS